MIYLAFAKLRKWQRLPVTEMQQSPLPFCDKIINQEYPITLPKNSSAEVAISKTSWNFPLHLAHLP